MKIVSTIKTGFMSILRITVIVGLIASCSNGIDVSSIEVDRLCSLADTAFAEHNFGDLLPALEKQFHVDGKKMRITEQGIFIPIKSRFVEENGYFLAKPGANSSLRSGDPALVRVKGCLFRYRIKG
jgi:hypothetical protein